MNSKSKTLNVKCENRKAASWSVSSPTTTYRLNYRLKHILLFLLSAFCSLLSFSQTVSQLTKTGDKKFAEGDYNAAALYYKDALKKDAENVDLLYKYAEASRLFNDYTEAAEGYKAVTKFDKHNQYPLSYFWLGIMLRASCDCKVQDAMNAFKKFRGKYRKKDYYSAKCQQELESCAWVLDHSKPDTTVHIEQLGKEINTENSEFGAIHVYPDRIQFSSLRNVSGDDKKPDYKVRIYNQPPNPSETFMPNGSNPSMHIGNGAYSPDVQRFYFTQCEPTGKTTSRCDIYVTKYEDYKWQPAQKLSDHVNHPSFTNTHPAVGYDLQGNEVLFFSSDRSGGQGGMDIWLCKRNADGTYQQAVNAGKVINTPGNEITPFYDTNEHKLYFSSDWHYGFGGYDIFETTGEYVNWSTPKNLLRPVNTPQNDLYYSLTPDNSIAYITSNRKGSYFITSETCCNDIYSYKTGKTTEKKDTATTPATDTLTTAATDEPKDMIDETLKGVKQKVEVTLYFHNDEPNPRTLSDTTSLNYQQTYEAYLPLREEYKREYTKGLEGEEKLTAEKAVMDFFTQKVETGFKNLQAFTSQLLELLEQGNTIEVTIKGYCSPLNYNQYNIHLGNRRAASLRNYFYNYRVGILLDYIAQKKLLIKTISFGEETAAIEISDKREDLRNSVYSPAAASERRVEIVSVEVK